SQAVAADQARGPTTARLAEQRQAVDGHAGGADLLQHRPERLRNALKMRRVERPSERDVEAILAQDMRIAEALQQEPLMVVELHALVRSGVGRRLGKSVESRDALCREPVERRRRLDRT